jgi:hypothetical protein
MPKPSSHVEQQTRSKIDGGECATSRNAGSVQIHLRLTVSDANLLRHLATQRDQTLSGLVRSFLRPFREARAKGYRDNPDRRYDKSVG